MIDQTLLTSLQKFLFDPMIGKFVAIFVGVSVILLVGNILKGSVCRRIDDNHNRYRISKLITFGSYLVVLLLLTIVFSDKLGGLTTAMGVAGAGVAFALQEVIASVAGWLAISSGGFFHTGDRVQLGGIGQADELARVAHQAKKFLQRQPQRQKQLLKIKTYQWIYVLGCSR